MDQKISSTVMKITPSMAEDMLTKNGHNRPMRVATILKYATDMAEGRWLLNGEPIILASNGDLLDGQHRLKACTVAGVPFEAVITTGVPADVFKTLGQGRARTVQDALALDGEDHPDVLGPALRWLYWWNHGRTAASIQQSTGGGVHTNRPKEAARGRMGKLRPSPTAQTTGAVLRELELCPQIRKGVAFAAEHRAMFRGVMPLGMVAFHHTMETLTAPEHSPSQFWLDVGGDNVGLLEPNSPELGLRNACMRASQELAAYWYARTVMPAAVRAWNAHCKGETLSEVRLRANAEVPEFYVAE